MIFYIHQPVGRVEFFYDMGGKIIEESNVMNINKIVNNIQISNNNYLISLNIGNCYSLNDSNYRFMWTILAKKSSK